jgi:5-methylcytosine-specific restriction endonuclease McrA
MSSRTTYKSTDAKNAVWDLAKPIRGKDPHLYKQDPYGNEIHYKSYGKHSSKGWEIDHIKPVSRGGSHDIINLQALKTSINRSKSDSSVKRSRHSQK